MGFFETLNDIRLLQKIAMVVAASLAIVLLLIKVPHSEHAKKLTRAKDTVAFSYLICSFIFGYTLHHSDIGNYEVFSALMMLINVAFSSATLGYSLINLLNYRSVSAGRLLISIFAIFLASIALVEIFFSDTDRLFKVALIVGIALFCGLCIYYIIIFDKLYKKGYHKGEVEEAISRAKGYRYIDDEKYAQDFAEYYGARTGRKKLEYKLVFEKGVAVDVARAAIADKIPDDEEREKALQMARKYVTAKRIAERKDLGKVGAHLYRNGFDRSVIDGVLDEIARGLGGDEF